MSTGSILALIRVTVVTAVVFPSTDGLLPVNLRPRPRLGGGRAHQVALVLYDVRSGNPPLQHLGGKLVGVPQVSEAHDVVSGLAVLHQTHCGQDTDLQSLWKCTGIGHVPSFTNAWLNHI